ncbi:16S rRNA (guanine(527)-N(7))-methyltransferase RsmG [Desulfopila inferna]|uniref:16S rRNA (guanine(527)-N(7))-methyltransferase RsmG n=1 Tax=Desulfopila inferna TaxID=468528 RepID=UPI0019644D09|nr:16S rRNA (guanine(527)-N(7))-methyltransferase RsmG [Desulfopila inferna]
MKGQPEDIQSLLQQGSSLLQLNIDDDALQKLEQYAGELLRWNKKINLIAKKQDAHHIVENHFLDSLILLPYLSRDGSSLIDVGSGAGFPGLACKAALPDLRLVLVEPRLKRVSFLRHIIRTLRLENVEVLADRLEDVDPQRLSCSHISSRAVAEIGGFIEMVAGITGENTEILCMKGPKWREELDRASAVLHRFGIILSQVNEFTLPFSGASRAVLSFRKDILQ